MDCQQRKMKCIELTDNKQFFVMKMMHLWVVFTRHITSCLLDWLQCGLCITELSWLWDRERGKGEGWSLTASNIKKNHLYIEVNVKILLHGMLTWCQDRDLSTGMKYSPHNALHDSSAWIRKIFSLPELSSLTTCYQSEQ